MYLRNILNEIRRAKRSQNGVLVVYLVYRRLRGLRSSQHLFCPHLWLSLNVLSVRKTICTKL